MELIKDIIVIEFQNIRLIWRKWRIHMIEKRIESLEYQLSAERLHKKEIVVSTLKLIHNYQDKEA